MKKAPLYVGLAIALTVLFYLAAYYLLPGPAPSGAMVGLFAGMALAIVWAVGWVLDRRKVQAKAPDKPANDVRQVIVVWALLGSLGTLLGCAPPPRSSSPGQSNQSTPQPSPPHGQGNGSTPRPSPPPGHVEASLTRVTGTAVLLSGQKEPSGYGLYSYVLLVHPPSTEDLPRYTAFLRALVDLPTAEGLGQYIPKSRINITMLPLTSAPPGWDATDADGKITFILKHYDYARSAAIRASLTNAAGDGPMLISVLTPLDMATHPKPVLIQDMSKAQADLMATYVAAFVSQAGQDRFWQPDSLQAFALGLRNTLETAAVALNLSRTAVDGWIKILS